MKISVAKNGDKVNFGIVEVESLKELADRILEKPYSLGTFKDDYRTKANFIQAESIGLDFDDGVTLDEATQLFAKYSHIIAPTRSHQIEKNGVVQDRFRVILLLSTPITDAETFESTWYSLFKKYPKLDKACKDASRFFYPSKFIHSVKSGGLKIDPVSPEVRIKSTPPPSFDERGDLGKKALSFLVDGAPVGKRHNALVAAARDAHQQGYSEEWFLRKIDALCESTGDESYRDAGALKAIRYSFTEEPRHEPRIEPKAFNLKKIGELYEDKTQVDWLVDSLLSRGGISLMSADPKAGKSTLVRQLIRDVLRGDKFLTRNCKQGSVYYFAIEEQIQVINASFKRLGVTNEDNLFVHVGDPMGESAFQEFRNILIEQKPDLVVVDTLFDLLEVESENNYKEVKKGLRKIRQIARESGSHIVLVHHNSKAMKDDKRRGNRGILGSQAIAGGVDTIIVLEVDGSERLITTSGREISRWHNYELVFNEKDRTYSLGAKQKDEGIY